MFYRFCMIILPVRRLTHKTVNGILIKDYLMVYERYFFGQEYYTKTINFMQLKKTKNNRGVSISADISPRRHTTRAFMSRSFWRS